MAPFDAVSDYSRCYKSCKWTKYEDIVSPATALVKTHLGVRVVDVQRVGARVRGRGGVVRSAHQRRYH